MVFNYEVVLRPELADLIRCVSKNREKGWECVGGIGFDGRCYMQAIQLRLTEVTGLHDDERKFVS